MRMATLRVSALGLVLATGCASASSELDHASGAGEDESNVGETSAALKCSQGDPDCQEPEPGGGGGSTTPTNPPPGYYRPDAMLQMTVFGCALPQVAQVIKMVKKQVPGGRATCTNGDLRIGAWRKAKGTEAQRDAAMNALSPRGDDETFGLFINGDGVKALISSAWASMPKRYSIETEKPDPDGSIYLEYWQWELASFAPNLPYGKLRIAGTYSPPIFSPVHWLATLYDFPSIDAKSHLACSTSDPSVDIDSWLPLELFVGDDDVDFLDRGPLCQAIDVIGTATSQLLVPEGRKIDFAYTRIGRNGNDFLAGGLWSQIDRAPSIGEMTANPVVVKLAPEKTSFNVTLSATLHDLRPPLTITWQRRQMMNGTWSSWTAEPGATTTSKLGRPNASMKTVVTWPRPNPLQTPTSVQARAIVTDADGLTASRSRTISISKTNSLGQPPICDVKPYLPQCDL